MGEVLVRGHGPSKFSPSRRELVQESAAKLTLALENFKLQQHLVSLRKESEILKRLVDEASSGASLYRLCRCFAGEIKALVEYHRLTVFLVDPESGLLISAYRAGHGSAGRRPEDSNNLSSRLIGKVVSNGRSEILKDLSEGPAADIWEGDAAPGLRSAILVPINHGARTVGVVVLELRMPGAYGSKDQEKLTVVTAALAPPMGRPVAPEPVAAPLRKDDAALEEMIAVLSASPELESVFHKFVTALSNLFEFDVAELS